MFKWSSLSSGIFHLFFDAMWKQAFDLEKEETVMGVWCFLAMALSGNSVDPSERLMVFAQYSWRLVLSQTLCSKAWERQKAAGRPAFPHSCPPPFWHPSSPSQYENKFSVLFAIHFPSQLKKKISLDNITYSRLCTENLAVHRSRTTSQKSVCFRRVIFHSAGSSCLAHIPPYVHIDQWRPLKW